MCTVTYIPAGNHSFFTSSRDEQADRESAVFPTRVNTGSGEIIFPKDPRGGGSWMALHESGNVAILLNGATAAHRSEPPYLKSRGLVLTGLISAVSPADAFEESDFTGIEPFTVILFENDKLYSGKWNGRLKWLETLNSRRPQIWSSVTLYDPEAIRKRESWFNRWLSNNLHPGTLDIIHFHQKGGDGNPFNDILMNRENHLFTQSISSIRLTAETASFRYLDLRTHETAESQISLKKPVTVKA